MLIPLFLPSTKMFQLWVYFKGFTLWLMLAPFCCFWVGNCLKGQDFSAMLIVIRTSSISRPEFLVVIQHLVSFLSVLLHYYFLGYKSRISSFSFSSFILGCWFLRVAFGSETVQDLSFLLLLSHPLPFPFPLPFFLPPSFFPFKLASIYKLKVLNFKK